MSIAAENDYALADGPALAAFVAEVLVRLGVRPDDARIVGDVLVAADRRGVESHGVSRLGAYYVERLRSGAMLAAPPVDVVRETPTTIVLDAGNGLGHPAGERAMRAVIEKAKHAGVAFGAVRNSNHYGIAGYYAMLALESGLIGMSSTNSIRYGAATYGRALMLGTNPWAYAIPAGDEPPFVLDFATTTVARGKLEVFERKEKPVPAGWALDADGVETTDPARGLLGALLPLGGSGVEGGGHKGYGLGLLADIMCGVLSGGAFGDGLPRPTDPPMPGKISHFFGAIDPGAFRDPAAFKADMDEELRAFKRSDRVPGQDRIYVAGEIEHERTLRSDREGVRIHRKSWTALERLAASFDVPFAIGR